MISLKLKLVYPHEAAGKPIISETVLKTGIPVNILDAKVTPSAGEMIIDVPASGEKLKEVISSFQGSGVIVKEITSTLEFDFDKCTSCGACVSPCPVQAIKLTKNWSIEFDELKCVRCGICVDACPVKVIRFL